MSIALTPDGLPDLSRLSPQAKAEINKQLRGSESEKLQAFYCKNPGRACDGHPHEGYQYEHARSDQWPPPGVDWLTWILMGGRGSGKTRTGSEYTRQVSKRIERIALIGQTGPAIRETMIEGDSGLIKVCERAGEKCHYEPSKRRVTFASGAIAGIFSAEEPDRLRGPQHGFAWLDEPAHFEDPEAVWDMMLLGLRLGQRPHIVLTTTPLPTKWMKARIAALDARLSRVSTYANLANLAPTFKATILSKYEGTRLGRQELYGEILEDVLGALWSMAMLQYQVIAKEDLTEIVVGVDPAGSVKRKSDETGIVVAGKLGDKSFVLEDATDKYTPEGWARRVDLLVDKWKADSVIVERNYGGDMVRHVLRSIESKAMIRDVSATRGKQVRAQPVVSMYEQKRVFHAPGLGELEDEMVTWVPDGKMPSPNRVDALVWALTHLQKPGAATSMAVPDGRFMPGPARPAQFGPRGMRGYAA